MANAPYGSACSASSWRGKGPAPARNQCVYAKTVPHEVHRDDCGNNFVTKGKSVTIVTANVRYSK